MSGFLRRVRTLLACLKQVHVQTDGHTLERAFPHVPMLRSSARKQEFVQTKVGPYPVERMPSNWQRHAGVLKQYSKQIDGLIEELQHEQGG